MRKITFFCFLASLLIFGSLITCGEAGGENTADDDSADDDDDDNDDDTDGDDDDDDDNNDDDNDDNDDDNDDNDGEDEDPDEDYDEVDIVKDNMIDDMEDGNGRILLRVGRKGDWYVYNDGTGEQDPEPDKEFVPKDCKNDSDFCAETSGKEFATRMPCPDRTMPRCSTGWFLAPRETSKST
jgi:hypothetical protein